MHAKNSKRRKYQKKATQNSKPSSDKSRQLLMLVLDSIVFLILVLAVSLTMIFTSLTPIKASSHYTQYDQTDEYIETAMQMVFSSTVPKVTYKTPDGITVEFLDVTFLDLIVLDLGIRNDESTVFNSSNLEFGPELGLKNILKLVFGANHDFILWAGFVGSANDAASYAGRSTDPLSAENIIITTVSDPSEQLLNSPALFEKHLTSKVTEGKGYSDSEVVIKFYLI
jgi:hypothetical protein